MFHSRLRRAVSSALAVLLSVVVFTRAASAAAQGPLRFQITLGKHLTAGSLTKGRLFVLMAQGPGHPKHLSVGFDFSPNDTWIAATEITDAASGATISFDPDALAYPHPFSQAHPGTWHVMALLDPDHDYAYHGEDGNDLCGPVVTTTLDPAHAGRVSLTLDRHSRDFLPYDFDFAPVDTPTIRSVAFVSPALSAFWGRPIAMRAGVVLPPDYGKDPTKRYATVYHVHGFVDDYRSAWRYGGLIDKTIAAGKAYPFVHVFLNASFSLGHTAFADSVNDGPWGRALTTEFIPYLEQTYHLEPDASARFLTGHSSGGWSTLWLQTTYPDFFGGTWSTSPDPVDLRDFSGVDCAPGSPDNMYHRPDGSAHSLVRAHGKEILTFEQSAKQEVVSGDYGGQFSSFEAVWSPRGPDGQPEPVFDRKTGRLDQRVLAAWQKYDIRKNLEDHWATLGPHLKGKIHLVCGDEDTYHLDGALRLLDAFFKKAGSDAIVEFVPGRDHLNLYDPYKTYPEGLSARIDAEMAAKYKAAATAP